MPLKKPVKNSSGLFAGDATCISLMVCSLIFVNLRTAARIVVCQHEEHRCLRYFTSHV